MKTPMAYLGFDRRLSLYWLDTTAGLLLRERDPVAIRAALHQQLGDVISGTAARRKTITLLCRIWVTPPTAPHLRDEALEMIPNLLPAERLWLHWGLTMLAYPFFRDITATLGRLFQIQGHCSVGQVTDRMINNWGERSTLIRATQRALRSLIEWDVIASQTPRGRLIGCSAQASATESLQIWLLDAALRAHQNEGVALNELAQLPQLFPFQLNIALHELTRSDRFETMAQGSGVTLVYPRHSVESGAV